MFVRKCRGSVVRVRLGGDEPGSAPAHRRVRAVDPAAGAPDQSADRRERVRIPFRRIHLRSNRQERSDICRLRCVRRGQRSYSLLRRPGADMRREIRHGSRYVYQRDRGCCVLDRAQS